MTLVKTICINNKFKRYYTGYVDNKHHLYGFTNDSSINNCIQFLGTYKSRYGNYPDINDSEYIKIKNNLIDELYREPILSIIEKELIISNEFTSTIIEKCSIMGIGLLLIDNFDFYLTDKKIDINFSASSIIPKKIFKF
jgi:hypothetical protein